ncbi:MAG: PDZ domain-containing protein [bacterium]|nr:PDZ domain-containing protein [bacterium]
MQLLILSILLSTCAQPAAPTDAQAASVDSAADNPHTVATNDQAGAPAADDTAAVDELIARLGSNDFTQREEATRSLVEIGPAAFDALAAAYRATEDYEIRLRVQDVVEMSFFQDRLFDRIGFLGVRLEVVDHQVSPHIPRGHTGVRLSQVVEDTAADRAGLRPDDIIVQIDGEPLPPDLTGDDFSRMIRDTGPGRTLSLSIDRDGAPRSVAVVLGTRPLEYYLNAGDSSYFEHLDETAKQFHRWWRQHFGRPAAPLGSRLPSTFRLNELPRDENPPPPDPSLSPGGRP